MKSRKLTLLICIIIFASVLLFIGYMQCNLTNKGILLNAKTLEWGISAKMGMDLQYEFYYEGKRIVSNNAFSKIRGLRVFESKYFPVMYDPELGASQLLIEPSDFKRFNIPFPDSLKWVLPYLK